MPKKRGPYLIGIHWCGGQLVKDGACQRCLSCDRVLFVRAPRG